MVAKIPDQAIIQNETAETFSILHELEYITFLREESFVFFFFFHFPPDLNEWIKTCNVTTSTENFVIFF